MILTANQEYAYRTSIIFTKIKFLRKHGSNVNAIIFVLHQMDEFNMLQSYIKYIISNITHFTEKAIKYWIKESGAAINHYTPYYSIQS
jgi:hypothetical protein